ncbi:DUF6893 family small protein [Arthrobacter sp. 92]|jgi:hypothetical protein|nr:hypothetical protein AHiyo6_27420 [Arthrobacter sp. Hiyo6]
MKGIGIFTVMLLIACGAAATVIGIRSIPDIKRYLRMRRM